MCFSSIEKGREQYVLEGPLGDAPVPENQDIMNAWQTRADDYSLV